MKRFYFFLALALLGMVSCQQQPKDCLAVMSFNIRNSAAADGDNCWENRREAVAVMLDSLAPAIVGMQEVLPDQEAFLNERCPQYRSFGIGRNDGENGERMTVFYNSDMLEFQDGGTWWLSETPDVPSVGWDAKYPRTATWVLMKDLNHKREFYFVNTHLDHRGVEARRNGLSLVVSKIREMNPDIPMVLVGDFNVEPGDPALSALDGLMLDARTTAAVTEPTHSFNGYNAERHKTIDYIYFSGFSSAAEFHVITDSFNDAPFISDHYPVTASLVY